MDYLVLALGLVLLALGAEGLVRGGVALARGLGLSPLVAGLTIVAWGTSAPELLVSVDAALTDHPGIAIGNVVGSNTFNILLILGLTALIAPLSARPGALLRDGGFAILGVVLFVAVALAPGPVFDRGHGVLFLGALAGLALLTYVQERRATRRERAANGAPPPGMKPVTAALVAFAGLAILLSGAHLLVESSIVIARAWGVSETVIGLTLVAGGTSLPELAASAAAALRRHPEVALGNIVGSNIYNIFAIVGVTALIVPVPVPEEVVRFDMWVMAGATLALALVIAAMRRVPRWFGALCLAGYCGYVWWLFTAATAA